MSALAVVVTAAIAVGALIVVIGAVRNHRLKERYAIIWIVVAVGMAALVAARPLLDRLSDALGIQSGVSTVFLISTMVILTILLQLSVSLTSLEEKVRDLAEALALAQAESVPLDDGEQPDHEAPVDP